MGRSNIAVPSIYKEVHGLGYERVSYNLSSDWDLMWAHDYPFKKLKTVLKAMKKGQKVNKLPGKFHIYFLWSSR